MSELIVLGLIPGTQLQITFVLWIILVSGLIIGGLLWLGHRAHIFRDWAVTLSLVVLCRTIRLG